MKHKNYALAIVGLIAGYLCWLAGVYAFSYGTSSIVLPATKFIKGTSSQLLTPLHFALFYSTDLFLIFLCSTALSIISGKRIILFIALMLWPVCFSMFNCIRDLIQYMNYYPELPSWVSSWFTQAAIAYLLLTPVMGWAGMILGDKLYRKRQAQQ